MKWKKEIDEWEEECKNEAEMHASYDKKDPNLRKKQGYIRPNSYRNQAYLKNYTFAIEKMDYIFVGKIFLNSFI